MLAVFVAELAPSGLQWITGAFFPRRVIEDRPLMGAPTQLPGLAQAGERNGSPCALCHAEPPAGFHSGLGAGGLSRPPGEDGSAAGAVAACANRGGVPKQQFQAARSRRPAMRFDRVLAP